MRVHSFAYSANSSAREKGDRGETFLRQFDSLVAGEAFQFVQDLYSRGVFTPRWDNQLIRASTA